MRIRHQNVPIHLDQRVTERVRHGESMGTTEMMDAILLAETAKRDAILLAETAKRLKDASAAVNISMGLTSITKTFDFAGGGLMSGGSPNAALAFSIDVVYGRAVASVVISRERIEKFARIPEGPNIRFEVGYWVYPDESKAIFVPQPGNYMRLTDVPYKGEQMIFKALSISISRERAEEATYVSVWGY